MTWDRRLYFPSEARHAEDFFALKIRRLRPSANPRTKGQHATSRPLKPLYCTGYRILFLSHLYTWLKQIYYVLPQHCASLSSENIHECLTLRLLMSYTYMEHPFLMFLDHTRRTTVARTPLDEWSARRRDLYLTTYNTHDRHTRPRWDLNPQSQQASDHRPTP